MKWYASLLNGWSKDIQLLRARVEYRLVVSNLEVQALNFYVTASSMHTKYLQKLIKM